MDIVIIAEFCEDFSKTDNDRFLYLAKMLAEDNQVEIITSSFRHTTKKQRCKPAEEWNFRITFINEPGYSRNVCLKRFRSHYVWGKNVEKYLKTRKNPDIIYCAIPSLTGPSLVAKYCEKQGIRFVIDVQDLWPEAFQMIVNVPVLSNIAFFPFKVLANGIYKRADDICAVSDSYCQRAAVVNNKVKKTTTVFLGTELATFDKYATEKPIVEKKKDEIWLAYCGTLGSSYDLNCVIDAISLLNDKNLSFIVMGDGPKMEDFINHAKKRNINALFLGRLQYNNMCSLLLSCDIVVNPIVGNSVASIINKHADYAASGKPVISTQNSEEYKKLISKYNMGFNCDNNNAEEFAQNIKILLDDKELRCLLGENARRCAEECFDRQSTYLKLKTIIEA